jgi:hypothetical protein
VCRGSEGGEGVVAFVLVFLRLYFSDSVAEDIV